MHFSILIILCAWAHLFPPHLPQAQLDYCMDHLDEFTWVLYRQRRLLVLGGLVLGDRMGHDLVVSGLFLSLWWYRHMLYPLVAHTS